jgi:dTDP-4-dehydrorhamnose reductase
MAAGLSKFQLADKDGRTGTNPVIVWITGAGGLIGNYLVQCAPIAPNGFRAKGLSRKEFELTDFKSVRQMFLKRCPGAVIHCAAMSRSPDCQANPVLARKINVEVTALLADLSSEIPFIFFSTDLVFDGRAGNYDERATPNPLSVYAETKVLAEEIVLKNPKHLVVRTSLNGGTSPKGARGFNEQMRRSWEGGQTLKLFTDEFRSPIAAEVTATATWELLSQGKAGIYHIAGSERLSRWQIGQLLAERWPQLNPKIVAASCKEYPGATRAPDTSLNCGKAQKFLSLPLPGLSDWLGAHPEKEF